MKFRYVQNIESDEPVMLLNKHIGMDEEEGMGIDGSLFQEELFTLDALGKKSIRVIINSVGGAVMDGYNICNAILHTKTPVDTYCAGMAASIAGVIFQCGRKRIMADYGILMYHNPYVGTTNESPLLDSMKDSLNTIIGSKSGMSVDAVHRMMDRTSFIQAEEALNLNLCDAIDSSVKLNTKYMPRVSNDLPRYREAANKVLNKLFDQTKKIKMLKVTNKLQLNDDANEESIVKAIDEVVNKAVTEATSVLNKKSKEEMDKMKADMEEMENKFKEMKNAYDAAKAELDDAEDKAKKVEEGIREEKAKAMIIDYVKAGKIKNEAKAITNWTVKAKEDIEGVRAMLEAIPTNTKAAKFEVVNTDKKEPVNSVAVEMARISNRMDKK